MAAPIPTQLLWANAGPMPFYNNHFMFMDAALKADPWFSVAVGGGAYDNTNQYQNFAIRDADTYPTQIPQTIGGQAQECHAIVCRNNYVGAWKLLWDGTGTVTLADSAGMTAGTTTSNSKIYNSASANQNFVVLAITASSVSDPVRNIRFLIPGAEAAGYPAAIISPEYAARFAGIGGLRFMDMLCTVQSSKTTWSTRVREFAMGQGNSSGGEGFGCSYELIIKACNALNCNMWLNIPPMIDDDHVTKLAQLILARLNPGLTIVLELGNEVWNGAGGAGYFASQAAALGGLGGVNEDDSVLRYYVRRSCQAFKIFYNVFGGNARLHNTLGAQMGNYGIGATMVSYWKNSTVNPLTADVGAQVHSLAVAPYLSAPQFIITAPTDANQLVGYAYQCMSASSGNDGTLVRTNEYKTLCNTNSIRLISYEGGLHFNTDEPVYEAQIQAAMTDSRWHQVYRTLIQGVWFANNPDIYTHYTDATWQGAGMAWGLLPATNSATGSYPRYLAYRDIARTMDPTFAGGFATGSQGTTGSVGSGSTTPPPTGTPSGSAGVTGSVVLSSSYGRLYTSSSVGLVLSDNSAGSTQVAFNNLYLQTNDWTSINISSGTFTSYAPQFQYNPPDGLPIEVPKTFGGEQHGLIAQFGVQIYPGTYNVKYDGDGAITFPFGSLTINQNIANQAQFTVATQSTGSQLFLQINRSNISNPIKNLRILKPGTTDASNTAQRYNLDFISASLGAGTVRFSEWQRHYGSPINATVPLPTSGSNQGGSDGVSIALCCDTANVLGATPWFCVPYQAPDSVVTALAAEIKQWLRPDLSVVVEYSSDAADPSNPQAVYWQGLGSAAGLSTVGNQQGQAYYTGLKYYARRAAQVFKIVQDYIGPQRVVTVLAGQHDAPNTNVEILGAFNNSTINPLSSTGTAKAEAFCTAPFVGATIVNSYTTASTLTNVFTDLYTELSGTWKTNTQANKNLANSFGLRYLGSAGGQNLGGTTSQVQANTYIQGLVDAANADSRMYSFYKDYFDAWYTINSDTLCFYASTRATAGVGAYGLMEIQTNTNTPKQNAYVDLITRFFTGTSNVSGTLFGTPGPTPSNPGGAGTSGSATPSGSITGSTTIVYVDRPVYVTQSIFVPVFSESITFVQVPVPGTEVYVTQSMGDFTLAFSAVSTQDLVDRVRVASDTLRSNKPTDAEIVNWLNIAGGELNTLISNAYEDHLSRRVSFQIPDAMFPSASLPADFKKLRSLTLQRAGQNLPIDPFTSNQRDELIGYSSTGCPMWGLTNGYELELLPKQAAVGTYEMYYTYDWHRLGLVTGSAPNLALTQLERAYTMNQMDEYLVLSAAEKVIRGQGNRDDEVSAFQQARGELKLKIVEDCTKRNATGKNQQRSTTNELSGLGNGEFLGSRRGPRRGMW